MKIGQAFPGALTNADLLARVSSRLSKRGFNQNNTLVASSLCSDEVNRPLEETFYKYYGNSYFSMGGLAGFPFSGLTGFGAMASHIPDDGNCLLVYGPHVGVDSDGNVGKVDRIGKSQSGTCCGSAVYASKYLNTVLSGEAEAMPLPSSAFDAQQTFVTNMLLPYASEIQDSKEPMVAIPFLAYKPIDNMMSRIVAKASSKVGKGRIAMLGGLQVCGIAWLLMLLFGDGPFNPSFTNILAFCSRSTRPTACPTTFCRSDLMSVKAPMKLS
jgi:Limiting CO2-inducible proteins B/C beta carbonyic anhydrases